MWTASPDTHHPIRRHCRLRPAWLSVAYWDGGTGQVEDVSAGGARIWSSGRPPVSGRFRVQFSMENCPPIAAIGHVIRLSRVRNGWSFAVEFLRTPERLNAMILLASWLAKSDCEEKMVLVLSGVQEPVETARRLAERGCVIYAVTNLYDAFMLGLELQPDLVITSSQVKPRHVRAFEDALQQGGRRVPVVQDPDRFLEESDDAWLDLATGAEPPKEKASRAATVHRAEGPDWKQTTGEFYLDTLQTPNAAAADGSRSAARRL